MTPRYCVDVLVEDAGDISEEEITLVGEVARHVLVAHNQAEGTELTILVTSDERIRQLNHTYRSIDAVTDVLSFSALEGQPFVIPEGEPVNLGDIVIALPQMKRQALAAGCRPVDELALLTVHGCLHLLGFDHADSDEQRRMWRIQDELLLELGYAAGPSAATADGGLDAV